MTAAEGELRARAESAGQGHLFEHWAALDSEQRAALLVEVEGVDFDLVAHFSSLLEGAPSDQQPHDLTPPELFPLERDATLEARAREARAAGEELLAAGKVGYLLVAGGQASRLGYDGPKGAFALGPVSGAPLFEIHARRLLAANRRYGQATPWFVMTSRANDAATRSFFEQHAFFGLPPTQVRFFSQDMVPALGFDGRILMTGPGALFLAPNGHGGVLAAFQSSGALDEARAAGLEQLSYFQVDNPLARPADPLFLGLHAQGQAGMSSKVVAKRDPDEKVGVLGRVNGTLGCIEYSDLPAHLRQARDADGQLSFRAGNIAIHALSLEFVHELTAGGTLALPWHVARKEMQVFRDGGTTAVQGAKFETFVFDALQNSPRSITLEVDRAREFSPVKNAQGSDSPQTARRDLCKLFSGWVRAAKLELPALDEHGVAPVEVDPCFAEDEHEFCAAAGRTPEISDAGHLYR